MNETALDRYVLNGGIMMVFLIPLAFVALGFMVQGFINLRRGRIAPGAFARRLPEILASCRTRQEVEKALEKEGHSLALILRRVVRHLEFKYDADPAEVLAEAIEEECDSLVQRNSQLALVYNVAPLMGLLGTVFGMITTFGDFTQSTEPSVQELSQGINVALLTTAWGLAVAIPSFMFLYFFTRRISTYERVILPQEAQSCLETVLRAIRFESRPSSPMLKRATLPGPDAAEEQV